MLKKDIFTVAPVEPGNFGQVLPEFGRHGDVRRIFGIKRGTLYTLTNAGLVRSVSLRRPGQKFSCRLWQMASIRNYLTGLMK
jgi:hypothetical protein